MSDRMLERSLKFIILLLVLILLAVLVIPFTAEAQVVIYRSVRPGNTGVLHDLSTNAITISGSTLTATNPFPDSIGVGDAVQYDSSNSGAVTSIAFLHGRTSSTVWTVKRANGSAPSPCTGDTDGDIYGAYISLVNVNNGTENTGISLTVRNFDGHIAGSKDLVSDNQKWFVACYPGTDATAAGTSFNCDATRTLTIFTPYLSTDVGTSQRHQGKFTGRCYFLSVSSTSSCFGISTTASRNYYITIEGLQFKNAVGNAITDNSVSTSTNTFTVNQCIFIGSNNASSNTSHSGIDITTSGTSTWKISNSIFYDWESSAASNDNAAVHVNDAQAVAYIYNCTAFQGDRGFVQIAGTGTTTNCIVTMTGPTTWQGTWGGNYNVDSRSLAPGANSTKGSVVAYVDSTNFDFHLKSTDTVARNTGTNLSGDSNYPFTDDIDGGTRPDITTWDRGADEQGVAYGVTVSASTLLRRRNPVQ